MDPPTLRLLDPQTHGPSDPWNLRLMDPPTLRLLDPQTHGPSDPWNLRPMDSQTPGTSDPWTLRPLEPQTHGLSDPCSEHRAPTVALEFTSSSTLYMKFYWKCDVSLLLSN
uniref:Uncharacterized protein n=1 Tax=Knipowitschia caucasica TaxID=637954 RepID=A0AAV2MH38_KNICA